MPFGFGCLIERRKIHEKTIDFHLDVWNVGGMCQYSQRKKRQKEERLWVSNVLRSASKKATLGKNYLESFQIIPTFAT